MSAKISASRRKAFLKALAETGNQTLAAERAKVSRSWVCLHRSTDPAFDAAVRDAVEQARTVLRQAQDERVKKRKLPLYHQGEELVVRGTGGRRKAGADRDPLAKPRVQIRRARVKEWTARTEQRFLNALAACCNIKRACAEVGLSAASQHNHAKRWPAFAAACEQALSIGATRIEAGLLANSAPLWDASEVSPEVPIPAMTAEEAIQLLRLNKRGGASVPRRQPGRRPRTAGQEEVKAALVTQLRKMGVDPSKLPRA